MNSSRIEIYPFNGYQGNTAVHPRFLQADDDHAVEEFINAADKFVYGVMFIVAYGFMVFALVSLLSLLSAGGSNV